eukprot:8953567-Alexandrium_andersonii.AAC.1
MHASSVVGQSAATLCFTDIQPVGSDVSNSSLVGLSAPSELSFGAHSTAVRCKNGKANLPNVVHPSLVSFCVPLEA